MFLQTLSLLSVLGFTLGMGIHPWSSRTAGDHGAAELEPHASAPTVQELVFDDELVLGSAEPRRPERWLPKLRRCSSRGARRFCDGPRMVPVPDAEDAGRAARLELGTRAAANRLLTGAPESAWIAAAARARGRDERTTGALDWPVDDARVSRGFGFVRRQALRHRRHDGLDFAAPTGTPVRAANDGIVAYADNGVSGFGNLVLVVHGDGSTTLYAHLAEAHVSAGQRVVRGQVLGLVGNTGLSRGPHLHFEWRRNGRPVDPARALTRALG
jgi:murein DD-endopeptidase MepM/ murein hydrolase activator NlpD